MKRFIERHFGVTLVLASALGVAFPYGNRVPTDVVIVLLATVIFLSFYRLDWSSVAGASRQAGLFCLARFAVLPLVLWYPVHALAPDYGAAVLLMTLVPSAVSAPAMTGLFRGDVALAFVITIFSSFLCVVSIPVYVPLLEHANAAVDALPLFRTLALCVLLPAMIYAAVRRNRAIKVWAESNGRATSVLLISFVAFLVLSKQRGPLLDDPASLIVPTLVASGCYAAYVGASLVLRAPRPLRVTYSVCSTFNNQALALSLAMLHFDSRTILCMIAGELVWNVLPSLIQITGRFRRKNFVADL